ncbi:MAG TPA: NAD(P)H-hydrate epimerase [Gemmataceae bacterium]|jgi:NAD(P)H-hydrate epimerase|nr:NAD(P)H-hydrate epimerase [Gemmataceae bacterium]
MTPVHLSRAAVRELDHRAIHEFGVPGVVLMENAGRGAAELLVQLNPARQRVLILCGPGNNGGDGFVMARHLQNHGFDVDVLLFGVLDKLSPDAKTNAVVWQRSAPLWSTEAEGSLDTDLRRVIEGAQSWIVDALFGTGLTRSLASPFADVVAAVNASGRPVLAVDIPSGLDCDTGEPLGPTIKATHTATFVAWKKGFLNPNAKPWLGEVYVIDIGAPKKLVDEYRLNSALRTPHSAL